MSSGVTRNSGPLQRICPRRALPARRPSSAMYVTGSQWSPCPCRRWRYCPWRWVEGKLHLWKKTTQCIESSQLAESRVLPLTSRQTCSGWPPITSGTRNAEHHQPVNQPGEWQRQLMKQHVFYVIQCASHTLKIKYSVILLCACGRPK